MAVKKRWPFVLGGIALALVLLVVIALWQLDAILLKTARKQADAYSQKLGRPIAIGDISTRLFPHVGAKVSALSVGAAQGEEVPLANVQSLEVSVAAWPLLTSRGKDIHVENAEISGLTLNVIRFADGSTNVQRLQERLAQQAPPQQQPSAPEQPRDLSGVKVDRAALVDGTIQFIDQSQKQARALAVKHLDIEVKDLRVGQPLAVKLDAAVLAEKQNLHLSLDAAPLPPTFVPTPKTLTLKADHVDLAPLGDFLPRSVGLQAGTLDANWTAALGDLVPGGEGPTKLDGTVKALGLQFAGAEGGKRLDVVLDTKATADIAQGDLALERLELQLGPAQVTGKGRVKGLLSEKPAVEGFSLVTRGLDPAALAAYYPPLRKQLHGMIAGPIGLEVKGGGTQAAQALTIDVDLTPVQLRIPAQLAKEKNTPMRLTAKLAGAAATGGAVRFDAQADLSGVDLRPGLLLAKTPGQKMQLSAAGTYRPARGSSPLEVRVQSLSANLNGDPLTGSATIALEGKGKAKTTRFTLALKSPHLDADKLLLNDQEIMARNGGKLPAPPDDPHRFDGMRGEITAQVDQLRYQQMDLSHLSAQLKMVDDTLTVEKLSTGVYGGTVTADGTTISLGPKPAKRPFSAKVQARGIDLKQALAARTPKPVLGGNFNGNVDVQGTGYTPESLKQTLLGAINGNVLNGTFYGEDLLAKISGPLAKALPFAGKALKSEKVTQLGEKVPFGVHIKNGVAQLDKPISWTRPQAQMQFTGGVRLDGTLALTGTIALTPATIHTITAGKVTPQGAIPVALRLTGKAWAPEVTDLDVKPAVETIAKQAASQFAGKLLGKNAAKLNGILGGGAANAPPANADQAKQQAQQQAQKKADEEKAKLEQEKKRAEEEAKKRLRGLFGH